LYGGLSLAALSAHAWADTTVCTPVTALPFTIAQPGVYCLDRNLTASAGVAYAIRVTTDDVSLDLNGFTLAGSGGAGTTTIGITADGVTRRNVSIRNGTVRNFAIGISLGPGDGLHVERIRAEGNTQVGVFLNGRGSVRDSEVVRTGGSTASPMFGPGAFGIVLGGQGSTVINNSIVDTGTDSDPGPTYGIYVWAAHRSIIEGNRVAQATPSLQTNRKGIYVYGAESTSVVGNRLTSLTVGLQYASNGSSGPYRDNICATCATSYMGGTNAGNNF
jgi:nitrous oxidase accessory protein NosD